MKKEFAIYCIYNGGTPFILHQYDTIQEAKINLYNLISLEDERNRIYYVDNDFYENKYPAGILGKYYKIVERRISHWEKYSEVNINIADNKKLNNVIPFRKIK